MPYMTKDKETGALVFELTPEEKQMKEFTYTLAKLVKEVGILTKDVESLKQDRRD